MSKRQARCIVAELKYGCTVKEFLRFCDDMGIWFDIVQGSELEEVYYTLVGGLTK